MRRGLAALFLALLPPVVVLGALGWAWLRAPAGDWFVGSAAACAAAAAARIYAAAPPLLPPTDALAAADALKNAAETLRAALPAGSGAAFGVPALLAAQDALIWLIPAALPPDPASAVPLSEAAPPQHAAIVVLDGRTGDLRDLLLHPNAAPPESCQRRPSDLLDRARAALRDRPTLVAFGAGWAAWLGLIGIGLLARHRRSRRRRSTI